MSDVLKNELIKQEKAQCDFHLFLGPFHLNLVLGTVVNSRQNIFTDVLRLVGKFKFI